MEQFGAGVKTNTDSSVMERVKRRVAVIPDAVAVMVYSCPVCALILASPGVVSPVVAVKAEIGHSE